MLRGLFRTAPEEFAGLVPLQHVDGQRSLSLDFRDSFEGDVESMSLPGPGFC
jgi:hypothetical protein